MASLDRPLKARLLPYLRRIRQEFRVPMLYAAYDPEEVASVCDEALIIDRGRIIRWGAPAEVLCQDE